MIEELTPQQTEQMIEHRELYRQIGIATGPSNIEAVQPILEKWYKGLDEKIPEFWRCESPLQANLMIHLLMNGAEVNQQKILDIINKNDKSIYKDIRYQNVTMFGSIDAYPVAFYSFVEDYLLPDIYDKKDSDTLNDWKTIVRNCGYVYAYDNVCFICDRPSELHFDDQWRLHSTDSPAFAFSDGWKEYYIHGVQVPEEIITHPELLTVNTIRKEANVEVRRCMIDIYGKDRFLMDSGAGELHQDGWGTLYRTKVKGDEDLVMVKVVNATPEADGTYKDYFIRVHHELRPMKDRVDENGKTQEVLGDPQELTALNAVASLRGMTGKEYAEKIRLQS